jgi:hypothetical protein
VRRTAAFLVALVAISTANPFLDYVEVTEFQTAPQKCERIELNAVLPLYPLPFDLGGSRIITNAGTAIVDSGVCFDTNRWLVVLDSTNTTGTFSLGDDSDCIRVQLPESCGIVTWDVRYPTPYGRSWAPPAGASASLFGTYSFDWYIDLSPTFGAWNDDDGGGIWGYVRDKDSMLNGATLHIKSAYGYGTATLGSYHDSLYGSGRFELKPTGPGKFVVTAECAGYLPYTYPETVELAPNEGLGLDICLERAGVAEEGIGSATLVGLCQRGRTLVLTSLRPGTGLVTVYDNLGRVRMSEEVALVSGSNELALPSLRSGVYFASCRFGGQTLKTKLVLY